MARHTRKTCHSPTSAVRFQCFPEPRIMKGDHPYVLGTRLKVEEGEVSEIDSLVT